MHNIKDIRKDIDNFKNSIKNRNVDIDFDKILNLDEDNRKLIQEKKKLFLNLKMKNFLHNQKKFQIK